MMEPLCNLISPFDFLIPVNLGGEIEEENIDCDPRCTSTKKLAEKASQLPLYVRGIKLMTPTYRYSADSNLEPPS